ncbi:MAG: AAA family ATPase [Candidatus Cryptobacteroides sp.]
MLKYIKIDSLFGLYSYTLDFTDLEEFHIKFITGPNGYGKTTLLSFVNALYSGDFGIFFKVPFKTVEFGIDENIITIDKSEAENPFDDTFDDTFGSEVKELKVHIRKPGAHGTEDYSLSSDGENQGINVLVMYLKSLPCYFIRDQRLVRKYSEVNLFGKFVEDELPTVNDNAEHLRKALSDNVEVLTQNLQTMMANFDFSDGISREDYLVRSENVEKYVDKLKSYGILSDSFSVYKFDEAPESFLKTYIEALEKNVHSIDDFVEKLDTFREIVRRFDFADKYLEIDPKFGYRFRLKNATETILSPADLSSGEQHILIMAYELIFKAQENSLVLIDEPEISFHLMWQMEFLRTLEDILNVRKNRLQFVVATHSPQVFDNRFKLSIDLFSQRNKVEE